jgi:hypothetical protein
MAAVISLTGRRDGQSEFCQSTSCRSGMGMIGNRHLLDEQFEISV